MIALEPTPAETGPISGHDIGDLEAVLVKLFTATELRQMLLTRMEIDLFGEVTSEKKDREDVVFDLINWLNHRQRVAEFLSVAVAERPRSVRLREFAARFGAQPEPAASPRPDATTAVEQFTHGLGALKPLLDRLANPAILIDIGEMKARLADCEKRIGWLRQYKSLHECLHRLQRMMTTLPRLIQDFLECQGPTAAYMLSSEAASLQSLVNRAKAAASNLELQAKKREQKWIGSFEEAVQKLDQARLDDPKETETKAVLGGVLERFNGLAVYMTHLNERLQDTAGDLGLTEMIKAMQAIQQELETSPDGHPAELEQYEKEVVAIRQFQIDLDTMVEEHDVCQAIETEFALAATQATADTVPFPAWPRLTERLDALCKMSDPDPDAGSMSAASAAYTTSLSSNVRIVPAFWDLRFRFRELFLKVDGRLLELTGRLAEKASSIGALNQFLGQLTIRLESGMAHSVITR